LEPGGAFWQNEPLRLSHHWTLSSGDVSDPSISLRPRPHTDRQITNHKFLRETPHQWQSKFV